MSFSNDRIIEAKKAVGITSNRNYADTLAGFEKGLVNLIGYSDGTTRPTGVFGGSATNLTKSSNSTNPLENAISLKIARTAAAQGQGYYFDFIPSRNDKLSAATLNIKFFHELVSGAFSGSVNPSVDSDLIIGVWDMANNKNIEPKNRLIEPMVSNYIYRYSSNFQIPINATTLRVYIHCATTNSAAFELNLDDLEISTINVVNATIRPPVGSIIAHSTITPPDGYLYCNGQTVSRTQYAKLFAVVGTKYGQGDGSTTFHVPDLRGRFLRGVNNGSGIDPDAASRTAMNTGGATGDNVGSVQADAFQSHGHNISDPGHSHTISLVNQGSPTRNFTTLGTDTHVTIPTGNTNNSITNISVTTPNSGTTSTETRPENANVAYMICYDDGNVQLNESIVWTDDVGSIQSFGRISTNVPQGYLYCDGSAISRSRYYELFTAIGTTFGAGDGSTTFNLPDLRGIFIRGAGSQTFGSVNYSGTLGTKQNDQFQTHGHSVSDPGHTHKLSYNNGGVGFNLNPGSNHYRLSYVPDGSINDEFQNDTRTTGVSVGSPNSGRTGSETYPANISLNYFIKYTRTASPFSGANVNPHACRYYTTAGQSFSATPQRVNFGTMKYDNAGLVQVGVGVWEFTAKESGVYQSLGNVTRAGTSQNSDFDVKIFYNGNQVDDSYSYLQLSAGNLQYIQRRFHTEDYLLAGQKIWVEIRDPNNGSLSTNAYDNWIAIRKVA